MATEQVKSVRSQDAMTRKDIGQALRKPNEEERWIQDALEDDEVRELLKSRPGQNLK